MKLWNYDDAESIKNKMKDKCQRCIQLLAFKGTVYRNMVNDFILNPF